MSNVAAQRSCIGPSLSYATFIAKKPRARGAIMHPLVVFRGNIFDSPRTPSADCRHRAASRASRLSIAGVAVATASSPW